MAINAKPMISGQIYLQDKEELIKFMERTGDQECPRDKQAYIIVRQPTEGDVIRLNELNADAVVEYAINGSVRTKSQAWDIRDSWRVFLCLAGAGNLYKADGKAPLFEFENTGSYSKISGEYPDFMNSWRELPDLVSGVIVDQVNKANTLIWGDSGEEEKEEDSVDT